MKTLDYIYGGTEEIEIGNKTGKYWRDKNKLLIYQDGVPVYENNNGVICRDSVALADGLM